MFSLFGFIKGPRIQIFILGFKGQPRKVQRSHITAVGIVGSMSTIPQHWKVVFRMSGLGFNPKP